MKILLLSFYFTPDMGAGAFRNTALFQSLLEKLAKDDFIHVITSFPNRYAGFAPDTQPVEDGVNFRIERVKLPRHRSGFVDQAKSYVPYYKYVLRAIHGRHYDLVYASSSRLFTAYLGRVAASRLNAPLYLDIRDIFVDTMKDVIKNKMVKTALLPILKQIERITFSKADHINLVSEGFASYFKQYYRPTYSYYTNGIDDEFLSVSSSQKNAELHEVKTIVYAGNIGEGQGLEKIIPPVAKRLGDGYRFVVIGSGGRREVLAKMVKDEQISNIKLLKPMKRSELVTYYSHCDFLFLHLNDYDAFKKVLPSKIFEYAAFNKPILAGVAGYAGQFIRQYVDHAVVFDPADVESMVKAITAYEVKPIDRSSFIYRFSRKQIMQEMADSIIQVAERKK